MGNPTDHLWMHFTRMGAYHNGEVPTIVRGDGAYVWDANGKRYLDGLAALLVDNAGHGRQELAEAAAKQATELAYFPLWSYAHPKAIELAERIATLTPGADKTGAQIDFADGAYVVTGTAVRKAKEKEKG